MRYFLCTLILLGSLHCYAASSHNDINPIIKNESFVKKFGFEPNQYTDDNLRIKTHLAYVESILLKKDISTLTPVQKKKRMRCIRLLHRYWVAGVFPENTKYEDRRPCFIDGKGSICAVGYLVEQTAGRALAEYINSRFQYAYIKEINLPELGNWVLQSGLTLEECAMIQPAYPSVRELSPAFTVGSILFSGTNVLLSTSNLSHYFSKDGKRKYAFLGMLFGTLQAGWGLVNYGTQAGDIYPDNGARNYFILNSICGVVGITGSALNLLGNKPNEPKNKVGFFTYPVNNKLVYGISFRNSL